MEILEEKRQVIFSNAANGDKYAVIRISDKLDEFLRKYMDHVSKK